MKRRVVTPENESIPQESEKDKNEAVSDGNEDEDQEEIIEYASDEDENEDDADVEDLSEDEDDPLDVGLGDQEDKDKLKKEADQELLYNLRSGVKNADEDPHQGTHFLEDSSEDEWDDLSKNRVGKIPMEFYEDYDHIGYNLAGQQVAKPTSKDQIQKFLDQQDDPNYWRTVRDVVNQKDVVLSKEEFSLVKSLMNSEFPQGFDPYQDFYETAWKDADHPLSNRDEPKRSFLPDINETKKIRKLVHAIHMGWIKTPEQLAEDAEKKKFAPKIRLIWDEKEQENNNEWLAFLTKKKVHNRPLLVAPKEKMPGTAESYNPPGEFLFDESEMEQVSRLDKYDYGFIPKQYSKMSDIPLYAEFIEERFHRCLELFLAPRQAKKAPKAKAPIPTLPPKQTLRPYPTMESMVYLGHEGRVRSISVDPTGQWMVSGGDDGTARIWEVDTGRCVEIINFGEIVYCVSWIPDPYRDIIAISADDYLYFVVPRQLGKDLAQSRGEKFLNAAFDVPPAPNAEKNVTEWVKVEDLEKRKAGIFVSIKHAMPPKAINWHAKGDYLVSVQPTAKGVKDSLVIHQISTHRSQNPFSKQKGIIQFAKFHPTKPALVVATDNSVKRYNLVEQKLEQRLRPASTHISCLDIHPKGDNILVGGYDRKVSWMDCDLSVKPYKSLLFHKLAVRKVCYHKRYPLFASCSDDLTLQIFHGMVYDDLLMNPLIIPLKVLSGHKTTTNLGILDCVWHPTQPWIFSCGADSTIRLFT